MSAFEECVRCIVGGPASLFVRFAILILGLPLILGGIVLAGRFIKPTRLRDRAMIASCWLGAILWALVPMALTFDWPAKYSPLVLHDGPYVWPAGCAEREYSDGDEISIACHDFRHEMSRKIVFEHGFAGITGRSEQKYFRVGSEAINFDCNYFNDKCTVRYAEHKVFR